jgi:hypothetical protein
MRSRWTVSPTIDLHIDVDTTYKVQELHDFDRPHAGGHCLIGVLPCTLAVAAKRPFSYFVLS